MQNLLFTEFNAAHEEVVSSSLHLLMMGRKGADKLTMREVYDDLFIDGLSPMGAHEPVPCDQLHSAIQIFLCNDVAKEYDVQKFQLACVERVFQVAKSSSVSHALDAAKYCLERNEPWLYAMYRQEMVPELTLLERAGAKTAWQLLLAPVFDMEMRTGVAYKAVRYYAVDAVCNLFCPPHMLPVTSARKAIAIYKAAEAMNGERDDGGVFVDAFKVEWEKEIRVQADLLTPFGNPFTN